MGLKWQTGEKPSSFQLPLSINTRLSQLCVLKASKYWFTLWDIICLHGISFYLFISLYSLLQLSQSFSHPLCSSHYLSLTVCSYEIPIPFTLSFGYGLWIMHLSLSLFYSCIALSGDSPVTRFPSLLPPASFDQRKSDKIRPGTLCFVWFLVRSFVPFVCLPGVGRVGFYGSLCAVINSAWLGGYGERVIKCAPMFKSDFIASLFFFCLWVFVASDTDTLALSCETLLIPENKFHWNRNSLIFGRMLIIFTAQTLQLKKENLNLPQCCNLTFRFFFSF